jgi:hypothetical protein
MFHGNEQAFSIPPLKGMRFSIGIRLKPRSRELAFDAG